MFDFGVIRYLYFDVLFSSFSLIILLAAVVFVPIGIWVLKTVRRNLWGIGIAFVLYLLTLLIMCYEKSGLDGIFYGSIFSGCLSLFGNNCRNGKRHNRSKENV